MTQEAHSNQNGKGLLLGPCKRYPGNLDSCKLCSWLLQQVEEEETENGEDPVINSSNKEIHKYLLKKETSECNMDKICKILLHNNNPELLKKNKKLTTTCHLVLCNKCHLDVINAYKNKIRNEEEEIKMKCCHFIKDVLNGQTFSNSDYVRKTFISEFKKQTKQKNCNFINLNQQKCDGMCTKTTHRNLLGWNQIKDEKMQQEIETLNIIEKICAKTVIITHSPKCVVKKIASEIPSSTQFFLFSCKGCQETCTCYKYIKSKFAIGNSKNQTKAKSSIMKGNVNIIVGIMTDCQSISLKNFQASCFEHFMLFYITSNNFLNVDNTKMHVLNIPPFV